MLHIICTHDDEVVVVVVVMMNKKMTTYMCIFTSVNARLYTLPSLSAFFVSCIVIEILAAIHKYLKNLYIENIDIYGVNIEYTLCIVVNPCHLLLRGLTTIM